MRSSRGARGASNAAQQRCSRRTSSLSGARIAASTGRSSSRAGLRHEVLVERVGAGHQHAEPAPGAAGATPALAQARHRAREADDDRAVQHADVDAELQGARGDDRQQVAVGQAALELAALLGGVAGAVGRDAVAQVAARQREVVAHDAVHHLDGAAAAGEADHALVAQHERGRQRRRLGQRRGALAELGVQQRRVPEGDLALGLRRAVDVDRRRPRRRSASTWPRRGFAIVADASRNCGAEPASAHARRRRRSTLATCAPKTPR